MPPGRSLQTHERHSDALIRLASSHHPLSTHRKYAPALFVLPPNLVANFLGDHAVSDVKVVQKAHLHFCAYRERAILESVACKTEGDHHVVENSIRCCVPLHRLKLDVLDRVEDAQIHLFDALPPPVRDSASWGLPHRVLGIEFDALVNALRVLFLQMHGDEIECILALLLMGL